ncbi:thymidylate synthase/dCMP hydroxymethylase domain-containing protein [Lactarius quietus]|nr:thymidylate synthase/dCMP hydroxymethylase domain-containing protein [Lactarius quietus]
MALPPCYMMCQFYPTAPRRLSCLMYQRSADLGLGIPSNIAFYALLTHIIARVTNTQPHELIIQLGEAYVCQDHIEALSVSLTRKPRTFPTLRWTREVTDINDITYEDFAVEGYNPHHVPIALASDPEAVRVREWRTPEGVPGQ